MILNGTNGEAFESTPIQPAVDAPPAGQQDIYSFNSFCGVGTAQVGRDTRFRCKYGDALGREGMCVEITYPAMLCSHNIVKSYFPIFCLFIIFLI